MFELLTAVKDLVAAAKAHDLIGVLRAFADLADIAADAFGPKPMTAAMADDEDDEDAQFNSCCEELKGCCQPTAAASPEVKLNPALIPVIVDAALKILQLIRERRKQS